MISYREKQLLMAMKMLKDDTEELSSQLSRALSDTENGKMIGSAIPTFREEALSFEDLVSIAEAKGYDT